ncbi:MAG: NmrA/HSCARG family protein [Promethearchaeota archaeon]
MTFVRPLYVLVTGATGKQGGSVVQSLLDFGHRVRGLTRVPESKKAISLEEQGVEIVKGDFKKPDTIRKALEGVDAIFLMGTPFEGGVEEETDLGITVVDIAKEVGVKHLVYSSVGSAHKNTSIPHFDSKFKVEEYIRDIDIPHTIIRPVFFMENFFAPWTFPGLKEGRITAPMKPDRKLAMIAVRDIGRFAVHVFENRDKFLGKSIDIASDEHTHEEIARKLSRVIGRKIKFYEQSSDDAKALGEDMVKMYKWFNEIGYDIDLEELNRNYPTIKWTSFDDWAEDQDWTVLEQPLAPDIS